jgi:hypothetical protein
MRLAILCILISGCATSGPARPYPIHVRGLFPNQRSERLEPGVAVIADGVTAGNWLTDHRELLKHITWSDATGQAGAVAVGTGGPGGTLRGGGGAAAGGGNMAGLTMAGSQELRFDDLPLIPLPAFRVEIQNETNDPVGFDQVSFELDDGHGHVYKALPSLDEIADAVVDEVKTRHPELANPNNKPVLDNLRESVRGVPLWSRSSTLKGGEMKAAYVSFRMSAVDAAEFARVAGSLKTLTLHITGLTASTGTMQPIAFEYSVPKRPSTVQCADGSRAPHWRMCPKMAELPYQPLADGPCIQQTKVKFTFASTQWWAGATPVANSDVWRMLLTERSTHDEIKKGVGMRWAGYMTIGASLLATVLATASLATNNTYHGTTIPYYGLTPLGLLPVGVGLVAGAVKHTERAIESYNSEVEETGACAPVW